MYIPRNVAKTELPDLVPYKIRNSKKQICVFDCETDPFENGSDIKPFTCGFYDGETYVDFWGDDCIDQFAAYIIERKEERLLIYAHNLGGFDIHFLVKYFETGARPMIVNGRIIKTTMFGQEWRDSYKILPVPLKELQKDDFDYMKNKREVREQYRDEICLYQMHDCQYLYNAIRAFFDMFGDRITIGNCAINMFKEYHQFETLKKVQDDGLRDYFYGGRTECFELGVLDDDWKVYDVNSMYPYVMAGFQHPISNTIINGKKVTPQTAFLTVEGTNYGAFPSRGNFGELDFNREKGVFKVTIHEFNAALELGLFKPRKIISTKDFGRWSTFADYVNKFYNLRLEAKANGDKFLALFYKLLLNNAYGKFAQNPEKYLDYSITDLENVPDGGAYHIDLNPTGWQLKVINEWGIIWGRKSLRPGAYLNVATGASITGAARSVLLRAIHGADRPIYCDTDSVICRSLAVDEDASRLGAWKLEATGTQAAIGGKKLYALFDGNEVVKKAAKGVGLSALQIREVARGEEIVYKPEVPTFTLDGKQTYTDRTVKRTG